MLDEEALDRELGAWFARSGRVLEVREATTPWQVLVVEVMSQQTQIGRVGPYWRRFVERWPTPAAFAEASTRDVLNAWAGLGYNRRPLALRDAVECQSALRNFPDRRQRGRDDPRPRDPRPARLARGERARHGGLRGSARCLRPAPGSTTRRSARA